MNLTKQTASHFIVNHPEMRYAFECYAAAIKAVRQGTAGAATVEVFRIQLRAAYRRIAGKTATVEALVYDAAIAAKHNEFGLIVWVRENGSQLLWLQKEDYPEFQRLPEVVKKEFMAQRGA